MLFVGADDRGIELEIMAVPDDRDPDSLILIHTMPTDSEGHRAMTRKRKTEYVPEPDFDLEVEDFQYQVERLTNERAEQIAGETLADLRRRNLNPGGKSLSGGSTHSPRVQFRVPEELRTPAERVAHDEGVSLSALARHALADYLRSRAS